MIANKNTLFLIVLVLLLSNCQPEPGSTNSNRGVSGMSINEDRIINVDQLSTKAANLSDLFSKVGYIPLEATTESLIGRISHVREFEDQYYVLDNTVAKKVFIFDDNGKYVNSLGLPGRGPGEFSQLIDFTIDQDRKELLVLDAVGKIVVFDLKGNFQREIVPESEVRFLYTGVESVGNSIYLVLGQYAKVGDMKYLLKEINSMGGHINYHLDMEHLNKGAGNSTIGYGLKSTYLGQEGAFFVKEFMDTIYLLKDQKLEPFLASSSAYQVTRNDLENLDFNDNLSAQISEYQKVHSIGRVVETNKFVSWIYQKSYIPYIVIYDKQTKQAVQYEDWKDDLSFTDDTFYIQPPIFSSTAENGTKIIGFTNNITEWMKGIDGINSHVEGVSPQVRDHFVRTFDNEENPVLIIYHL